MTQPLPATFCDQGNPLLGPTPAQMVTALLDTPEGQRIAVTIRTPSTTCTVLLDGKAAKEWSGNLSTAAAGMSSAGLVAANGHLPNSTPAGQ